MCKARPVQGTHTAAWCHAPALSPRPHSAHAVLHLQPVFTQHREYAPTLMFFIVEFLAMDGALSYLSKDLCNAMLRSAQVCSLPLNEVLTK